MTENGGFIDETQILGTFRRKLGEKLFDSMIYMLNTMKRYLSVEDRFTGQIIFTINCRNGGIGNVSASVMKKI